MFWYFYYKFQIGCHNCYSRCGWAFDFGPGKITWLNKTYFCGFKKKYLLNAILLITNEGNFVVKMYDERIKSEFSLGVCGQRWKINEFKKLKNNFQVAEKDQRHCRDSCVIWEGKGDLLTQTCTAYIDGHEPVSFCSFAD